MSDSFLELYRQPKRELERLMQESPSPDLESLKNSEFDGLNTPWYTSLLGIKKFRKGFYEGPSRGKGPEPFLQGYNIPVRQNGIEKEWIPKPSPEKPKHFGFYRVYEAEKSTRDRKYSQALLLNYGQGGNPIWAVEKFLRDYLVQPYEDNPDLLLGKAYVALGMRIPVSFFILRRCGESTYSQSS